MRTRTLTLDLSLGMADQVTTGERLVYAIGTGRGAKTKLGHTSGIRTRRRNLQTANEKPLGVLWWVPGGRDEEQFLHNVFAEYRLSGEWFSLGPVQIRMLDGLYDAFHGYPFDPQAGRVAHLRRVEALERSGVSSPELRTGIISLGRE